MMRTWKRFGSLLLAILLLLTIVWFVINLAVGQAAAGTGHMAAFDLSWDVVASGGRTMSSDSFILLSTTGQPVVGDSASASYSLLSGYWAGVVDFVEEVLLPIVLHL
ncbi:MAG: hypothetical protein JSV68_04530 [Anaerolineaceae bacterium]|nr:MAG: hypothetical protein JSV68_04530 [Anaerolineaceae bacterium]